jgi:hypothetical protein
VNRRKFLQSAPVAWNSVRAGAEQAGATGRKRITILSSAWTPLSHAQHLADTFLVGYPRQGKWRLPIAQVVSAYVDQTVEGDQSKARGSQFGFSIYSTVPEAMRCGGNRLAVDAVLIILENGRYLGNQTGLIFSPGDEVFRQVAQVFEEDRSGVPVFNYQNLSHSFENASRMLATSERLKFPLLAGCSLPVTWRLPVLELPWDCRVEDALMVGVGSPDCDAYRALEAMQSMLERRHGGETGAKAVQLIEGEAVWKAGEQGRWSKDLLRSALSRSFSLQGLTLEDARPQDLVGNGELPRLVKEPAAYLIDYRDGLNAALLMLNGAVADFTFAARIRGTQRPQSTQFLATPPPNEVHLECLAAKIEEMIETGRAPYPVKRTLLAGGILERCLESKARGARRLETPELNIRYRPPRESSFCAT